MVKLEAIEIDDFFSWLEEDFKTEKNVPEHDCHLSANDGCACSRDFDELELTD